MKGDNLLDVYRKKKKECNYNFHFCIKNENIKKEKVSFEEKKKEKQEWSKNIEWSQQIQ